MNAYSFKEEFVNKYDALGEARFYKFLLCYAVNKLVMIEIKDLGDRFSPELEFLEHSEKFLLLYRRDDQEIYLVLARVFRKAAHKIYRMMLKKNMIVKSSKFLNLV